MAKVAVRRFAAAGVGFGTSGVRATVDALTDEVSFAYARAFLQVLERGGALQPRGAVALGHDLRPSSPRITAACVAACWAAGARPVLCGAIPTPAVAFYALQARVPAIMITGSHIPFDRNGIKFYRASGEILKEDEAAIAAAEVEVDAEVFDERGALRAPPALPSVEPTARAMYLRRYLDFFPEGVLHGRRVGVYEHSSLARDLAKEALAALGAEVVSLGRTDTFVPIDTEAVSEADQRQAERWVAEHRLDALVSTDGDSDRPLVGDERGSYLRGDAVGMLCAGYLGAATVVTPVSSNTAVERWGRFRRVVRTRIGSPYVIAAMEEAARAGDASVVGYEANGGFLLGSPVQRRSASGARTLAPLPTRDAMLPMLAILCMAAERGCRVSQLMEGLPERFTASDRVQEVPTAASRALLDQLSADEAARTAFFGPVGKVSEVNRVDGVRVTLDGGDVVHLRPSGNAPELRCYAEAATPTRAAELCRWGLGAAAARVRST
ncbi:MAG TPA: phosphomannomutase [Anaeromyxobacteraceae bacterium]|nr:phosphomannomutase [Anaeromyxobacteraceae bacterium]